MLYFTFLFLQGYGTEDHWKLLKDLDSILTFEGEPCMVFSSADMHVGVKSGGRKQA